MIKQMIYNCLPYGIIKHKVELQPKLDKTAYDIPEVYNSEGEKIKIFYLKDKACVHTPYTTTAGRLPKRILWDRYNTGLPIHFYTQSDIFEHTMPCNKKFAKLGESETILPKDYEKALKNPEIMKEYDKIFTHSARILDKYDNAIFTPANGPWYGTKYAGGQLDAETYHKKEKNISIVSSDKQMCDMHKLRVQIARSYCNSTLVDSYGAACGNYIEKKADALTVYRYSIAIENDITPFYFTEKILDCFAAMCVPIYIGATEIGKYFNKDGIIQVKPEEYENMDAIISKCCKEDYAERQEAIIDNFNRVQNYLCFEDYIMRYYSQLFD